MVVEAWQEHLVGPAGKTEPKVGAGSLVVGGEVRASPSEHGSGLDMGRCRIRGTLKGGEKVVDVYRRVAESIVRRTPLHRCVDAAAGDDRGSAG